MIDRWQPLADAARTLVGPYQTSARLRLAGSVTAEEWAAWRRLRDADYFLIRNRGGVNGERARCGRCSGEHIVGGVKIIDPTYHEFFTWACVDRPWRGLEGALWGYATLTRDERMQERLTPWAPNATLAHPRTFGLHTPANGNLDLVAITLASRDQFETLTEAEADALVVRINARITDPAQRFRYD